jgi:hypothetical protein
VLMRTELRIIKLPYYVYDVVAYIFVSAKSTHNAEVQRTHVETVYSISVRITPFRLVYLLTAVIILRCVSKINCKMPRIWLTYRLLYPPHVTGPEGSDLSGLRSN